MTKRVLIVDDSEITIEMIKAELGGTGLELLGATCTEEAISLITKRATRPDLILLDINMPRVDGAKFCRFVKTNEMFAGIKVILCSGMDREKIKRVAEEYGADGFVCKDEYLSKWVTSNLES